MATEAAAKQAESEATGANRRFWHRISRPLLLWRRLSTPLLVTLIGLALSAWLLPAITRQWDDRQKAHELKAAMITDMASATAQVLVQAEELHAAGAASRANRESHSLEWSRARLQIAARLQAYFPPEIHQAWQLYAYFVSFYDPAANTAGIRTGAWYIETGYDDPLYYDIRAVGWRAAVFDPSRLNEPTFTVGASGQGSGDTLARAVRSADPYEVRQFRRLPAERKYADYERALLFFESTIADRILAAHPEGYSTTAGDLLRDLIP